MFTKLRLLGAIGVVLFPLLTSSAQEGRSLAPPDNEVQTRGRVHEAFAQAFDPNPGPAPAAPKQPPPPIAEAPPQEGPEGSKWIGGYWAWNAERGDFVWVSGAFRKAPEGRQFVPGHWVNTPDGWRWVEGFWAPASQTDFPYVGEPPAPLEAAPSMPPPDDNSAYVPGYWLNRDGTFVWRPGFYTPFRTGRVWISPRYVWTPAGYIFVAGYWDYAIEDRVAGRLAAPPRTIAQQNAPNRIVMPLSQVARKQVPPTRIAAAQSGGGQPTRQLSQSRTAATPRAVTPQGAPIVVASAPRPTIPQARSFAQPVPHHHVAAHTAHAGRTINHTPARTGGGGGHHGGRH